MFATTETAIIERLRARLPSTVTVEPLFESARKEQLRNKAPAVWVIHRGYTAKGYVGTGQVQSIEQAWDVVITTASALGNGDSTAARDEAAEIAEQILGALLGYHLGAGKYLHLTDAQGPAYDAGYCELPLAFTNAATFKGTP